MLVDIAMMAAVAIPLALLGWRKWPLWSPRRRQAHVVLSVLTVISAGVVAGVFVEEALDSGGPVLVQDFGWYVFVLGLLVAALVTLLALLPWRPGLGWLVLAPFLWLMVSGMAQSGGYRHGPDALDLLTNLVLVAWLAMVPWALPAAWQGRATWHGKAEVGVAALFVLYSLLPVATEGLIWAYGPQPATQTFTFEVEADGEYRLLFSHFLRGPWEGFSETPGSLAAADGDIRVLDGPGGIYLEGAGEGRLTMTLQFYGSVGDQEWHYRDPITIRDHEGVPLRLTIHHETAAPYCHFENSWNGTIEGPTDLASQGGVGICS